MTELPNTIGGTETSEDRYYRALRSFNIAVARYNSAIDALDSAQREYDDAARWLDEGRHDLNRAASVLGWEGAP